MEKDSELRDKVRDLFLEMDALALFLKYLYKNHDKTSFTKNELYNDFFEAGIFICRACKSPLYESNTKFDSGCGWPSFDDEIEGAITRYQDLTQERVRVEICCAKCDGHLGHVFYGEKMTEKDTRHCVNSLSIQFKSCQDLEGI